MLGEGILKGLAETAKNFAGSFVSAERLTTVEYPEQRIPTAENARMTWWALKILRNNDFTPEEVVWRKGIDHLRERLGKASSESVVCQIVDQINDLVRRINTLGTNAINLPVAPMSRETALEQFRLTAMPAREEGAGSCHFGSAREE